MDNSVIIIVTPKVAEVLKFLAEWVDETSSWTCLDFQYDHALELAEVLGQYTPQWLSYVCKTDQQKMLWKAYTGKDAETDG